MSVISIIGAKGGTLKTSSAHALAHAITGSGVDVVLVDADPQASLTRRCGLERLADPLATDPVTIDAEETSGGRGRLVLLPGGRALEAADEARIAAHLRRAASLGGAVVIVDTPPALGPIVSAAMAMSHAILIPCTPGADSLDGLTDMVTAARGLNPGALVRAILVLVHRRSRILRWTQAAAERVLPGTVYPDLVVPYEVAGAEAGTLCLPVTASAPRSRTAAAYRSLARRLLTDLSLPAPIPEPTEV